MRLTSLHLRTPELRLDDLSPGFNAVFAPYGETRRLIPAALRCVLFGAPADWLPSDELRSICELGVLSPWGRFDLERIASPSGERLVARDSSGENRSQWLRQRMLGDFPEAAFAAIFTPRFGDHAAFDALVRQAHGESGSAERRASLENLLRELEATRPWEQQDEQTAQLREREARLLAEIEQLEQLRSRPHPQHVQLRARAERRLALWERRWKRAQQQLADASQRLEAARHTLPTAPAADTHLRDRLTRTRQQIARLENVIDDLKQRGESLRARLNTVEPVDRAGRQQLAAKYYSVLHSLTHMARKLAGEIATLNARPVTDGRWTSAATRLLPRLESLNQKLHVLCERLKRTEADDQREQWEAEYRELATCQTELSSQLEGLLRRRDSICKRLARENQAERSSSAELATLEMVQASAQRRARQCQDRVLLWRRRLERLHARQRPSAGHQQRAAEAHRELAEVRRELAELSQQERGTSEAMLGKFRDLLAERRYSAIFDEASRTLRQLTDGELVAVRPRTWGNDVVIEHARGKAVTFDVLSRAERDQVHLSLALATAADAAQRGCAFPLVLNDALRHVEPGRLRAAIELLRDYCRLHGQVLLLSSQQNVATLCRSIGVASFHLDRQGNVPVRLADSIDPLQNAGPSCDGDDAYAGDTSPVGGVREVSWDCEEFPGELRDRTQDGDIHHRRTYVVHGNSSPAYGDPGSVAAGVNGATSARASSKDTHDEMAAEESLRSSGFYLQLCDRISEVPFLTRRHAREIESFGIFTVANFLHADPARLAERLAAHGTTQTDVRRWQGQARLMCGVRKLRAYDAKILVACGVTAPEQLADIRPHELSEMVEAFVATPEGSRLVRSGSDFEISRITRWIRSVSRPAEDDLPGATLPIGAVHSEEPAAAPTSKRAAGSGRSTAANGAAASARKGAASSKRGKRRGSPSSRPESAGPDVLSLKFYLDASSHIEAAPSIGPQMAKQLEEIGITTVANLLVLDSAEVARRLDNRRVTADVVHQWQRQAELVCRIPQLRGHDAQILVACEIETPEQLAAMSAGDLYQRVLPFAKSKQGQRILRSGSVPSRKEVADWIGWAQHARQLHAA